MLQDNSSVKKSFDLTDRVVIITGGAGLLGVKHAEAVAEFGGVPILVDIDGARAESKAKQISQKFNVDAFGIRVDITREQSVENLTKDIKKRFGGIDVLINNASVNPKVEKTTNINFDRIENLSLDRWHKELEVGLTGAFICSRWIGTVMARQKRGVILNVSSDLGVIAPDQRIYRDSTLSGQQQPTKPVTYSVIKHGLIGLTRYLATYWADCGVRANSILPGGIFQDQSPEFVSKISNLIPLGRMAHEDEYRAAVVFLISDASSYMTGANICVDGGRSAW